ncbi:SDR family oxidoreductase [Chryseobacterium sp.]|uniref:SDR family oxidoreductase n=1 Tax=Chryseobacterium sp. TaxID=1871047 RepID=UPI0025C4298F|nr:SDR family oxidoreductase [Chryseobacterium sp.]MBV8327384.1 SDR family oxidoreductase [Chryseobacterium sp.]
MGKLDHKSVLITGADSGIGRAVAFLFALEGADVAIIYHSGNQDAESIQKDIENLGRKCIIFQGDINDYEFCEETTQKVISQFKKIDILINNAGVQFPAESMEELKENNIGQTFDSNIVGMILLTKVVFPYLKEGSCVINTTSVSAYQGHPELLDYSATRGAIVSFTRSLALQAKPKGIRVNAVALGPVAIPLTQETSDDKKEDSAKPALERSAGPEEIAFSFLFLAGNEASQMTGQVLLPNGGLIING